MVENILRRIESASVRHTLQVVIVGGGVAALEACLALRSLAGKRVELTLLAPNDDFVYRPMAVFEPYEATVSREQEVPGRLELLKLTLREFAAEVRATLVKDALKMVDPAARVLTTVGGRSLRYDALLVAAGAKLHSSFADAVLLHPERPDKGLNDLISGIESGSVRSAAFIAPKPSWPLPVYELALLARNKAVRAANTLSLSLITAEAKPLEVFGSTVSERVATLLAEAGIELITGASVSPAGEKLIIHPGGSELNVDRIAALPRLAGQEILGLPANDNGFLPTDSHGRVSGTETVFAAGDGTDFPVKFGSIAAQQADAAAEVIALQSGVEIDPRPIDGVIRGVLVTGLGPRQRLYCSARIEAGEVRDSSIDEAPEGERPAKVEARYLAPYLEGRWEIAQG